MPTVIGRELYRIGENRRLGWLTPSAVDDLSRRRRLDFGLDEYADRHTKVVEAMNRLPVDAIVSFSHSNVRYLTGFHTFAWTPFAVIVLADRVILCVPDDEVGLALTASCSELVAHFTAGEPATEVLARYVQRLLRSDGRVGVDMSSGLNPASLVSDLAAEGVAVADTGPLVETCRLVLSRDEQQALRAAAVQTAKGMRRLVAAGVAGARTDADLAAALYSGLADGTDGLTRGQVAVATGWASGLTHASWTGRSLQPGTTTFLEFAGTHRDYCAPVIRTLSHGPPGDEARSLSQLAHAALEVALTTLRVGLTADDVATRGLAALGQIHPHIYFHGNFGYPVGLGQRTTWKDNTPFEIVRGSQHVIKTGMAFHIPAAMIAVGRLGVGHSHTVIVQRDGLEVLTQDCGPAELVELPAAAGATPRPPQETHGPKDGP
jgi:Xaa-Pro dipeptidase